MEQKKSTLKEIKATVMPQTAEGLQMLMEETGLTVGEVIDRLTLQIKCSPSQGQNHLTHCGSIPAGCSPVEMYS